MTQIDLGSHVTLHYRVAVFVDGQERDVVSTMGDRPATLQMGAGQLAPVLEQRLLGLAEGASATFDLGNGEAYGPRNPQLVQTLTRAAFDANAEPDTDYQPGDVVAFKAPDGSRYSGVLKQRDAQRVVVDFNHPLAGLPVRFSVQVIGVL